MNALYSDNLFTIVRREDGVIHVQRTDYTDASLEEWRAAMEGILSTLQPTAPNYPGVIMDYRKGSANNDPAFEATVQPYRQALRKELGPTLYLVRTQVGQLHMKRLGRTVNVDSLTFTDEREAVRYLLFQDRARTSSRPS